MPLALRRSGASRNNEIRWLRNLRLAASPSPVRGRAFSAPTECRCRRSGATATTNRACDAPIRPASPRATPRSRLRRSAKATTPRAVQGKGIPVAMPHASTRGRCFPPRSPLAAWLGAALAACAVPLVAQAATLPVTSCADDGSPGTLRSGVNAAANGDVVDLTQLACSKITLTQGPIDTKFLGPIRSMC